MCSYAAKNVALAGVKRLVIHDAKVVSTWDLNTQYYLSEEDVGKNRATVSVKKLGELNPYVITEATTQELGSDLSFLDQFHVRLVVLLV
jgi:ubiquitin-activating enzyme E1